MSDDIIGMEDMAAIYEITDLFEIDRETISVPLEKSGDGSVGATNDGAIEIVVPATVPIRDWLPVLRSAIEKLGFSLAGDADSWE
jgi:hypothetical protein